MPLRLLFLGLCAATVVAAEKPVPRLAVLIAVDQMRADFLVKFRPYFGEGGFKRLLLGGANYPNCHYQHAISVTAPGHATILSGVNANVHGIIANDWKDPQTLQDGNAVEDSASPLVGLPPRTGRYPNATLAAKAGRRLWAIKEGSSTLARKRWRAASPREVPILICRNSSGVSPSLTNM